MGATITRANFGLSAKDRADAQQRLEHLSGHHPAIERSRLLLDDDWDGVFRRGLGFLLDGLSPRRSEEHTSELQSLMRISYAVFCLKKKKTITSASSTAHITHEH